MGVLNFKEQLKKDNHTFFNTSEFAEIHSLCGKEVPIVMDEDEIKKRKMQAAEGTYVGEKTILVQKGHLVKTPVEGQKMTLDDETYYVVSCDLENMCYRITLGNNSSW